MILVTGGTGFIGRELIQRLIASGYPVRSLLRPSPTTPNLPTGLTLEVALTSLLDRRGVRAALIGVDTVIHLAGGERYRHRPELVEDDIEGTRVLAEACAQVRVHRFVYLSHLGASLTSAYPLLRAKARCEENILRSGVSNTILRPSLVYGPDDHFTTSIAMMASILPIAFPLPGDGSTLLQPLALADLVTSILWMLDDAATLDQRYEIGGPEYLSFREIVQLVLEKAKSRRLFLQVRPPFLRLGAWFMERFLRIPPISSFWLDYLAVNRTAELETLPRVFGLHPRRMRDNLGYLAREHWMRKFWANQRLPQRR
jgi:nucleoside-diphosphate-sugar epimerase